MVVDMGTGLNALQSLSDHRAILDNSLARFNPMQGNFVTRCDGFKRVKIAKTQRVTYL